MVQKPRPWGNILVAKAQGWGHNNRSNPASMPGLPPLGLNIDTCIDDSPIKLSFRHFLVILQWNAQMG